MGRSADDSMSSCLSPKVAKGVTSLFGQGPLLKTCFPNAPSVTRNNPPPNPRMSLLNLTPHTTLYLLQTRAHSAQTAKAKSVTPKPSAQGGEGKGEKGKGVNNPHARKHFLNLKPSVGSVRSTAT